MDAVIALKCTIVQKNKIKIFRFKAKNESQLEFNATTSWNNAFA